MSPYTLSTQNLIFSCGQSADFVKKILNLNISLVKKKKTETSQKKKNFLFSYIVHLHFFRRRVFSNIFIFLAISLKSIGNRLNTKHLNTLCVLHAHTNHMRAPIHFITFNFNRVTVFIIFYSFFHVPLDCINTLFKIDQQPLFACTRETF